MKTSIALGFAASILASTAAFASPQVASPRSVADASSITTIDSRVDSGVVSKDSVKPFDSKSSGTVVVAENRKEFGSGYQRY